MGVVRLKSVGYIVDDLPKNDKLYVDLKFFEQHFSGVMPLEIVVDTKRKQGVTRSIPNLTKIDSLVYYLEGRPEIGKALAVTEGLKFARQAYYDNDSNMYAVPNEFYLRTVWLSLTPFDVQVRHMENLSLLFLAQISC